MAIDYQRLRSWPFDDVVQHYTSRDTILYALGVGLGEDPTDANELTFLFEEGLKALPTLGVVLSRPGFWVRDPRSGVDWKQVLHGEQGFVLHRPLPAEGEVSARTRIDEIVDKGPGKGALIYSSRTLIDRRDGEPLCTLTSTTFCRGDGGFGGPSGPSPAPRPIPQSAPELTCDLPTSRRAALIYRLSGDLNPLHIDPEVARVAGFPRPILHGLATYGVAGHALLRLLCGYDPSRLTRMDVRFSSPVFPGETIRTEIWRTAPGQAAFRSRVVERDVVVLNNGYAEYW
ncbi:MAG: MaoC/PaaZ C-terminal domain-containing protein [Xanthobacteraceae bacterium]|jgi:acyl dehydratase